MLIQIFIIDLWVLTIRTTVARRKRIEIIEKGTGHGKERKIGREVTRTKIEIRKENVNEEEIKRGIREEIETTTEIDRKTGKRIGRNKRGEMMMIGSMIVENVKEKDPVVDLIHVKRRKTGMEETANRGVAVGKRISIANGKNKGRSTDWIGNIGIGDSIVRQRIKFRMVRKTHKK